MFSESLIVSVDEKAATDQGNSTPAILYLTNHENVLVNFLAAVKYFKDSGTQKTHIAHVLFGL
jgi:hypothetical protein